PGDRAGRGKSRTRPRLGVQLWPAAAGRAWRPAVVRAPERDVVIDLLVSDDRQGFGIATALAVEGIPARRITRAADFEGRVLVATADQLDGAAAALARPVPAVARGAHAAVLSSRRALADVALGISRDDPIWPAAVRARAHSHGDGVLHLPRATAHLAPSDLAGTVLATVHDGHGRRAPAVVQR